MTARSPHRVPDCELAPGYRVPRIISGGWQLSRGHRQTTLDPSSTLVELRRLVEGGLTTFDCGDIYLGVEQLLGKLLQTSPDVQIHTKFVPDRDRLATLDRKYVETIIDRSLRRLGVERLDLVQFAWWDYRESRYVDTAGWLDEQRQAGKIRLLGVTNFDVPHLAKLIDAGIPIVAHQVQYSLLDRRPDRGMRSYCAEHGIQLLAYGTLAGGFLSERYLAQPAPATPLANRSLVKYRLVIDSFGGWNRYQKLLEVLKQIAITHGVSIANVAVRWTIERDGVAAAIVGAFDAHHLNDNLNTFRFELNEEDRQQLAPFEDAGPEGGVYEAERVEGGEHAAIMKYNLNCETDA